MGVRSHCKFVQNITITQTNVCLCFGWMICKYFSFAIMWIMNGYLSDHVEKYLLTFNGCLLQKCQLFTDINFTCVLFTWMIRQKCVDLKIKHNIKQFDAIIKWSYNDIMFTNRQLTIWQSRSTCFCKGSNVSLVLYGQVQFHQQHLNTINSS